MMIPFGRRRLMISLVAAPVPLTAPRESATLDATDAELARLRLAKTYAIDRARWEATAMLLGGFRPQ